MSSTASIIATARDRRNRRLAAFRGQQGGDENSSSSSQHTLAAAPPPSLATTTSSPSRPVSPEPPETPPASPQTKPLPTRHQFHTTTAGAVTPLKTVESKPAVILSVRSWDVDDAPRPRLSPRVNPTTAIAASGSNEPAAATTSSNNSAPVLLKLPDDLIQPGLNGKYARRAATPTLAPRWSPVRTSKIPPSHNNLNNSSSSSPGQQHSRKLSSSSLPSDFLLSQVQDSSSNAGGNSVNNRVASKTRRRSFSSTSIPDPFGDDMSSLEDELEDDLVLQTSATPGAIVRMNLALKADHPERPHGLNRSERQFWETIMMTINKTENSARSHAIVSRSQEPSDELRDLQQDFANDDALPVSDDDWRERMATQERDHLQSLQAIQRVLADVTAERDEALRQQKNWHGKAELHNRGRVLKLTNDGCCETIGHQESDSLFDNQAHRRAESQDSTDAAGTMEAARLAKELEEKSLALENAKMIITSLEQASNSLATDLRGKLKCKDDAIAKLTADAADKQKILDSLAMELRELQRRMPPINSTGSTKQPHRLSEEETTNQQVALSTRLERNINDLRAQACVMESIGRDTGAVESVIAVLLDSIAILKSGMLGLLPASTPNLIESRSFDSDSYDDSRSRSPSPVNTMPSDPRRLHRELEEKTRQLHRTEEALKKQREETQRLEEERRNHRYGDVEVESMRQEILSLREHCQTNMEVLSKKERELAVLRDSLKVDDDEVGYISDDATEASDPEEDAVPSVSSSLALTPYGPSQAEALATLLSHGGRSLAGDVQQGLMLKEMRQLYEELNNARIETTKYQKQCRTESDSLANAKMIISSLENANKSMMQDLRSRLQDSNTAIATLLEKSMESENTTLKLRQELERLQDEKDQEAVNYELQIQRLRSNNSYDAMLTSRPVTMFSDYKVGITMETID